MSLCALVWVASYWGQFQVIHQDSRGIKKSFGTNSGRLYFMWGQMPIDSAEVGPADSNLAFHNHPADGWSYFDSQVASFHIIGFAYFGDSFAGHVLTIPLWLPVLLSALLLWFVWRKIKPKSKGKAFPIEPSAPTMTESPP